ncbi:MAG: hypothetical protein AAGL89_15035, partial [Pseudomonadota bacterium]
KVASSLAALMMVIAMTSVVTAEEVRFSLPELGSDPVVLHLQDNMSEAGEPPDLLQVFVGSSDSCCDGRTPVAGRYEHDGSRLAFLPAFGFEAGQDYVARATVQTGDVTLVPFQIASDVAATDAAVTSIYPSGDVLPENVLRFYIHFATPMAPHVAFDHIRLRDASGIVDEAAFMQFKQELWNEDRTRLTVLIDPGRIKRNVATNVELGPALLEGQRYTLEVAAGWPSADGRSVLPGFAKSFTVGSPLRTLPSLDLWDATRPCVGTQGSLYVTFDRPFDRHLLERSVSVTRYDGSNIEGTLTVGSSERSIIFTPAADWSGDTIRISIDATLEDVAANNFRDLLDHVGNDSIDDPETELIVPLNAACR